jgi:hypothetical protein
VKLDSVWPSDSEKCSWIDGFVHDKPMANERVEHVMVATQRVRYSGW